MKRTLLTFAITIATVLLIRTFAFTSCTIPSSGMENSLYQGDRVIVNRWSYGLRLPFMALWGYQRWGGGEMKQGDILFFNDPTPTEEVLPIDEREIFVARCIGKPGDTLMLNNELLPTEERTTSPDDKRLYVYPGNQEELVQEAMQNIGIQDNQLLGYEEGDYVRSFSHFEIYLLSQVLQERVRLTPLRADSVGTQGGNPFIIPAKGTSIKVYPWNAKLLCNTINTHEGRKAALQGDTLYVDGNAVSSYRFTQDYCWVAAGNSINVCDSRLFGFVPSTHWIGRASFIWYSKDETQEWKEGFRWKRFFTSVQ